MSEDPRITQARNLMIEVEHDEWLEKQRVKKEYVDNMICACGHKHAEHTPAYTLNYTGGFCKMKDCKCRNFICIKAEVTTNKQK